MKSIHLFFLLIVATANTACGDQSENAASSPEAEPEIVNNEQVQNRGANKDNWWDALPRPEWSAFEKVEQSEDWVEGYRIDDDIYAI